MKKIMCIFVSCLVSFVAMGFSATSITQYGITWTFDSDYVTGQFANGDYWVLGPVTIDSITPHFTGTSHGWEVNPDVGDLQGLEAAAGNFSADVVPNLPYTANGGESILKARSSGSGGARGCIQVAAVLTIVEAVPPDSGATVFRPPVCGYGKTLLLGQ